MESEHHRLRVVVLHGARGSPETNWFPWLRATLGREGIEVLLPRFPTPEGQSLESWMHAYDGILGSLPVKETILVGHSLGSAFALRLAERADQPFRGLFLAAPFIGALGLKDYDEINRSFFERPFEWDRIRRHIGPACYCWAGADDPYIPLSRSAEVAEFLHTHMEIVPGGGHLNSEANFRAFPRLRDAILAEQARDRSGRASRDEQSGRRAKNR